LQVSQEQQVQQAAPGEAEGKQAIDGQLLDQLYRSNSAIQSQQNERFEKNFYKQNRKGVEASEAF
jgi:hypothetical protein